jgi:hypothetical protein
MPSCLHRWAQLGFKGVTLERLLPLQPNIMSNPTASTQDVEQGEPDSSTHEYSRLIDAQERLSQSGGNDSRSLFYLTLGVFLVIFIFIILRHEGLIKVCCYE